MPRIKNSDYLRMSEAAKMVYELTGVRRCMSAVHKWASKGVQGQHGSIIKLRIVRKLNRSYTTRVWLKEFIEGMG